MNGKKLLSSICCMLLLATSQLSVTAARAADQASNQNQEDDLDFGENTFQAPPLGTIASNFATDLHLPASMVSEPDALSALSMADSPVSSHKGLEPDLAMAPANSLKAPVTVAAGTGTRIALAGSSTAYSTALTPGALEAAELLGIAPYVQKVITMRQAAGSRDFGQMSDEEMGLRVELMDRILGEILEVRVVADRIDRELSWSWASKNMLQAKQQRELNMLFTANFMQGGVLGILSGPAFLHGKSATGTELLLLASSIGLALSLASFYVARTGSKRIDGGTTMLADVFGLNYAGKLHHPERVMKFLNSVPPGSTTGRTRKEELIANWQKIHALRSMEEKNLLKLAAVEGRVDHYKENIGLLSSRIRLLYDSQWTIEQLDSELLELLRAID